MAKTQFEYARFDEKESLKWQLLKRKTDLWWGGNLSKNGIVLVELIGELDVIVVPKYIPYKGGIVTVTYGGPCRVTYSNGYSVRKTLYLDRNIDIPSRDKQKEGDRKYDNIDLNGEFNGDIIDSKGVTWIFGQIKWDDVIQLGLLKASIQIDMKDKYLDTTDIPLNAKCEIISVSDLVWDAEVVSTIDGSFDNYEINNSILSINGHFVGDIKIIASAQYGGDDFDDKKVIQIDCKERIIDPRTHVYTIEDVASPIVEYNVTSTAVSYTCKDSFKYFNGDADYSSFYSSVTATFKENTGRTNLYPTGYTDEYEDAEVKQYTITQKFNPNGVKDESHWYEIVNVLPNPAKIAWNIISATFTYDTVDHYQYYSGELDESGTTNNTYETTGISEFNNDYEVKKYTEKIYYENASADAKVEQDINHDGIKPDSYKYSITNVLPNPAIVAWDVTTTAFTYTGKTEFEYYDGRPGELLEPGLTYNTTDFDKNTGDTDNEFYQVITYHTAKANANIKQTFNPYGIYDDSHKYSIENVQPTSPAEIESDVLEQKFTYYCKDSYQFFNKDWSSSGFPSGHTVTFETANTSDRNIEKTDTVTYETESEDLKVIQKYNKDNKIVSYEGTISNVINPSPLWDNTTALVKFTGTIYGITESGKKKQLHQYKTLSYTVTLSINDSDAPKPYKDNFTWDVLQTIKDKKLDDIDTTKSIVNPQDEYDFNQGYNPAKKLVSYECYGTQTNASTTKVKWNASSVDIKYYGYCKFVFEQGETLVKSKNRLIYTYDIPDEEWNDSGSETTKSNKQFKWEVTTITSTDFSIESGSYFPSAHSVDEEHQPYVTYSFKQGYNPDKVVSFYSYEIINVEDPNADYTKQTVQIKYVGEVTEHYESGNEKQITPTIKDSQSHDLDENVTNAVKPYEGTISWDISELQTKTYIDKNKAKTQTSPVTKDYKFNQGYNKDNKVTGTTFVLTQCDDGGKEAETLKVAYNIVNVYIPYKCHVIFKTEGKDKIYDVYIYGKEKGHYWESAFDGENKNYIPRLTASTRSLTTDEETSLLNEIINVIDKDSSANKDVFKAAIQESSFSPVGKTINLSCQVEQGIADIYLFYNSATSTPTVKTGTSLDKTTVTITSNLYKVVIGESVTSVTDNLFANCRTLQEFNSSNGKVTVYGDKLFDGCTNLTAITFSNVATTIGNSTFNNCESLTAISLPNTITNVGSSAFTNCSSLTSVTLSNNQDFKTIKEYAFYKCTSLTGITIPSNVQTIEKCAFMNDTKFGTIVLTEGLETIGNSAFTNCFQDYSVRSTSSALDLPNTVKSVGEYAFCNCTYLNGVTLSTQMSIIERYTFANCNGNGGGTKYSPSNGLRKLDVLSNILCIEEGAFSACTCLSNIDFIPTNATISRIGAYAFYMCYGVNENVTDLVIPDTVIDVGNASTRYGTSTNVGHTFYRCAFLKNTKFSKNVSIINISTFESCVNMETCDLQYAQNQTLKTIDKTAFFECQKLDGIKFPDSLLHIKKKAFMSCFKLSSINITPNVEVIGDGGTCGTYSQVFSYCPSLASVTVDSTNKTFHSEIKGNCCLYSTSHKGCICFGGNNPTFPTTGTSLDVGQYAFEGNIHSLYGGTSAVTIPNNFAQVKYMAFSHCTKIKELNLNENLTSIDDNAFEYCTSLTGLTTPSSLESIGNNAFQYDSSMVVLDLNENLQTIGNEAFTICTSIIKDSNRDTSNRGITIPSTVTFIGNYAFYKDNSATNVTIGKSVSYIGNEAFSYTSSVSSITVDSSNSTYCSQNNLCLTKNKTKVIFGCYESELFDGIQTIGDCAFKGNIQKQGKASTITFPSSIVESLTSSFAYCGSITKVVYPSVEKMTEIKYSNVLSNPQIYPHTAYVGKNEVKEISVSNNNSYLFCGNRVLTSITFNSSIGKYEISGGGNSNLVITVKNGDIESYAFRDSYTPISTISFEENVTGYTNNDTMYGSICETVILKCNSIFKPTDTDSDSSKADFNCVNHIKVPSSLVDSYKKDKYFGSSRLHDKIESIT